jgi:hypothetical protein
MSDRKRMRTTAPPAKYRDPFYVLGRWMDAVASIEDPEQRAEIGAWLAEKYDREDKRDGTAGMLCSCGRPAVQVFDTERFGAVGYCGAAGRRPLDPCDCGTRVGPHDRAWCRQRTMEGL